MKNSLALILAASVGLAACSKKEDLDIERSALDIERSATANSTAIPPIKIVEPTYGLAGAYQSNDFKPPKVYFYNDPEDSSRRCQTVTHLEGVTTNCWKREPN